MDIDTCLIVVVLFLSFCAQCGTNTQLLHVFQEDFILGYKPQKEAHMPAFPSGEGITHCEPEISIGLFSVWSVEEDNNAI